MAYTSNAERRAAHAISLVSAGNIRAAAARLARRGIDVSGMVAMARRYLADARRIRTT